MFEDSQENFQSSQPFHNLMDKAAILQRVTTFKQPQVNVNECIQVILALIYLETRSPGSLTQGEASTVFMSVLQLTRIRHHHRLQRVLYMYMKRLALAVPESFMATDWVKQDLSHAASPQLRASALRAVSSFVDSSALGIVADRMRQCLTDRSPCVVIGALMGGHRLHQLAPAVVDPWSSSIAHAMVQSSTGSSLVPYHALALKHQLRPFDVSHLHRHVQLVSEGQLKAPMALALLLRHCSIQLSSGDGSFSDGSDSSILWKFVVDMTAHGDERVALEAADIVARHATHVLYSETQRIFVEYLRGLLDSRNPVTRFCVVRLLYRVAQSLPELVQSTCTQELQERVHDPNTLTAVLAIMTLLQTMGPETLRDETRLMIMLQQLMDFMNEVQDDYKKVVLTAIRSLLESSERNPRIGKSRDSIRIFLSHILLSSLSHPVKLVAVNATEPLLLSSEGSSELRKATVGTLLVFIEDSSSEEPVLQAIKLVSSIQRRFVGDTVLTRTTRTLISRLLLSHLPRIRSASLKALVRLCSASPEHHHLLFPRIQTAIAGASLRETEDLIRQEALLAQLALTDNKISQWFLGDDLINEAQWCPSEGKLVQPVHHSTHKGIHEITQTMTSATATTASITRSDHRTTVLTDSVQNRNSSFSTALTEWLQQEPNMAQMLGDIHHSVDNRSDEYTLTPPDNEFVVRVCKHVALRHVILQYAITNTLDSLWMSALVLTLDDTPIHSLEESIQILNPSEAAKPCGANTVFAYAVLPRVSSVPTDKLMIGTISHHLSFTAMDAADGDGDIMEGYLESIDWTVSDYIVPLTGEDLNQLFETQWPLLVSETSQAMFDLGSDVSLSEAVQLLLDLLWSMNHTQENTTDSSIIKLAGNVAVEGSTGGNPLLLETKLFKMEASLRLAVEIRGTDEGVRQMIMQTLMS